MPFEPDPVSRFTPDEPSAPQEPSALEKTGQFLKAATRWTPPAMALKIAQKSGELLEEASYKGGGAVTDIASGLGASPEVAAGAGAAAYSIPNALLSMVGPGGVVPAAARRIPLKDIVRQGTLDAAKAEGYVVPPSATGSGHIERLIESIGGRADIAREASMRNQQVTNQIARREAGLAKDEPITEATLKEARARIAQPYEEIANISPRANTALEQLRMAREEAKGYWREYNGPNHPMVALKEAKRLDMKADAYEKLIDSEAKKVGREDLLPALQQARVQLAKNHDIERALNIGTGDIDAQMIGRMLDKRGSNAVTGGLQTIGKFAEAYSPFAKSNVGATDVNKLTPYGALLLGGLGYQGSQYASGHPYGAALGALPFLAPGARAIALSKLMQSGVPLSGIIQRPVQAGMVPLSQVGEPEPGRY